MIRFVTMGAAAWSFWLGLAVTGAVDAADAADNGPAKADLKFVAGPSAEADGENVRIDFEVNKATDVAVEIRDKDGKIVRHLVAGLLGPHAPEPLARDSLQQSLLWDRKDDDGKSVAEGCKVHVGLGMGVRLAAVEALGLRGPGFGYGEGQLPGERPYGLNIQSLIDLAVGPDGAVYLMGGYVYLDNIDVYTHIVARDRDGNYVRELYPPPAALTPDKTTGLKFLKLADGTSVPRADGICWLFSKKLAFAGKLAVAPNNKSLLVAASKSRDLFQLGLDGSLPPPTTLPDGDLKGDKTGLAWNWFAAAMAVSPDSRSVYVIGKVGADKAARPVVYRMSLADGKSAIFFGEGEGRTLTQPTGLAVDAAGNVLIADCGGGRVWVVSADGKDARELKMPKPFNVAAGLKESIYVLSASGDAQEGQVDKLTRLAADGKELASVDLSATFGKQMSKKGRWIYSRFLAGFGVDLKADKPVLWLGCTNKDAYPVGADFTLARITDDGDAFASPKFIECNGPMRQKLMKNFTNREAARRKPWTTFGYGCDVLQRDGYRYGLLFDANAKPPAGHLTRLDADFKEVPFPEMGEKKWYPLAPTDRTGYGYGGRLQVTPQKDLLVGYLRPLPAGKGDYGPEEKASEGVDKLAHDGKYIRDYIFGLLSGAGKADYRVDRKGCVYATDHTLPPDRFAPAEIEAALPNHKMHPRDPFVAAYGSLYKFSPNGGGIVWDKDGTKFKDPPLTRDDLIRKPTVVTDRIAGPKWRGGCENIEWQFIGVSPVPSGRIDICTCTGVTFDIDPLDRLFVPDAYRMCVHVLDSSGNVLLRFGQYGNQDDGRTKIAFARPRKLAVRGNQVIVEDCQNSLTTKLDVVYATEGATPVP